MIAVVADDITGAAEMGGIALRYGLNVLVTDDADTSSKPDVLIIYTNTRSMRKQEAGEVMQMITKKLKRLRPRLFYKKTDSVLRGHVLAEMKAHMQELNLHKGLLVPANPSLGRIIKNGTYYINDEFIHQTGFAHDPEFPVKSSDIKAMLGKEDVSVYVISKKQSLPTNGIAVGEAVSNEDVASWADYGDASVLLGGGASFFNALLSKHFEIKTQNRRVQLSLPLLLISGTAFRKNVQRIQSLAPLVSYMPDHIFQNDRPGTSDYDAWCNELVQLLSKHKKAIIAIDNTANKRSDPHLLREKKAQVAELVLEKIKIKELLIEGGSTAYSIIKKNGWQSFAPKEELQPGIVRMQVEGVRDLHVTIKPGSYDWPPEWNFN